MKFKCLFDAVSIHFIYFNVRCCSVVQNKLLWRVLDGIKCFFSFSNLIKWRNDNKTILRQPKNTLHENLFKTPTRAFVITRKRELFHQTIQFFLVRYKNFVAMVMNFPACKCKSTRLFLRSKMFEVFALCLIKKFDQIKILRNKLQI